jgi:hypothetical protein
VTARKDIRDVIDGYTGRARTVLYYSVVIKRLVDEAKKPGFSVDSWGPLAELVAVDEFERVGAFKEVMKWPDYVDFLTKLGHFVGVAVFIQTYHRDPRPGLPRT